MQGSFHDEISLVQLPLECVCGCLCVLVSVCIRVYCTCRFPGGVTLMHLVCILQSEGAVALMQKFQPENGILTTQDSEGTPTDQVAS